MKRSVGGYTLLEVMLFTAISGILFFAITLVFKGQYATTEFRASMNEVNSKVQQWIDQVDNGYSGSTATAYSSDVTCTLISDRPQLQAAPSSGADLGTNNECIFLGKTIHVSSNPNFSHSIYVYPVLGRRIYAIGSDNLLTSSLGSANPEPTFGSVDLTEVYTIPNGARVIRATDTTNGIDRYMAGIFTSFSNSDMNIGQQNGSSNLIVVQYPVNGNLPPRSAAVRDCIELRNACSNALNPNNPWPLTSWTVCFDNDGGDERGLLTITSSNGFGVKATMQIGKANLCN
jgi:Tfp pilus assembly protein PilE